MNGSFRGANRGNAAVPASIDIDTSAKNSLRDFDMRPLLSHCIRKSIAGNLQQSPPGMSIVNAAE